MLLESHAFAIGPDGQPDGDFFRRASSARGGSFQIHVGLVNNMPDAALKSTERQFRDVLERAAGDAYRVKIHLLALEGVERNAEARAHIAQHYVNVAEIADLPLDALIVTGAEPRAKSLRDEPYWTPFTDLIDWAERNTISTIFSCLAAHAAVLRLDGVERRPVGAKRSGIFASETEGDHPLLRGLPARVAIPHSRYNELPEGDLRRAGYEILTRSARAGVDMFAKRRGKSLFLFFQGHPEYEAATLLREYRRDVLRYLDGERADYPVTPFGYFGRELEHRLAVFARRAGVERHPQLASELPLPKEETMAGGRGPRWAAPAAAIYRNWLMHVMEAKKRAQVEWTLVETWCAQ